MRPIPDFKVKFKNRTIKDNDDIGQRLYRFRRRTGISQEALGKTLWLHQTAICRIEQGTQNMTLLEAIEIERKYGKWL